MKTRIAFSLVLPLLLWGCALGGGERTSIPEGATVLKGVPVYAQEAHQCGPAALAMVLGYWQGPDGPAITPEDVAPAVYSKNARGTLGLDLELYARRKGYRVGRPEGSLDALKRSLDEGVPPIIMVDYGTWVYKVYHFMVVTGYHKDGLVVQAGKDRPEFIETGPLLRIWRKTGNWMLTIRP
jgi:ABC-type bacteriocin/lantibiotic exporter with double-glycine peptidase domain